ncbi:FkbM family methyltransferase [Polynucleobacter necessarius]|uniref:FkbM family methyltransferase n=1 Tax=Polynucleobacter necessarius TaxID=576610 RepID=UPI000FE1EB46|nr:FkbM family methyltransferase [Polynucleobacter necessarius]
MTYNPIQACLSIANHPGNKKGKIRSVIRYIKWQISARLTRLTMILPWVEDAKLFMSLGEAMVTHNYYTGLYEYDDMVFLMRYLNSTDTLVDIGANSGVFSVLAAKVKKASVLAFEPVPRTYERLISNIQLNALSDSVICINKGLSSSSGELSFTTAHDATNHVCSNQEEVDGFVKVLVSTLDDEIERYAINPTVLKIDVEGYEYFVLEGASKVLSAESLNVILIELNDSGTRYGHSDLGIANKLISFGFKPYDYLADNQTLTPTSGYKSSRQNTLFIRDLELVKKKIQSSETFYIHPTQSRV